MGTFIDDVRASLGSGARLPGEKKDEPFNVESVNDDNDMVGAGTSAEISVAQGATWRSC